MNDNMFTCVICGEKVSKRQSVAYGETHLTANGIKPRACRKHPEVMKAMQERLAAEETKRHQELERKMQEKARRSGGSSWHMHIPQGPTCWHCKKEGVHAQTHFLRMMIANEKCSLQGKSFLDRDAFREAYGEVKPVLVFIKCWEGHDLVKRTRDGDLFWSMASGNMFVCRECAEKFNLLPEWEKALHPQDVTPEMLTTIMAISEFLPITHAVRAVAKAEVGSENGRVAIVQENAAG